MCATVPQLPSSPMRTLAPDPPSIGYPDIDETVDFLDRDARNARGVNYYEALFPAVLGKMASQMH